MKEYKLALSDEILMQVEKPARYIGNEVNSIVKTGDEKVKIRYAMCFPDVYEIGMSHLGMKILYDMLNRWEDVWCERVFSPWVDLDKIMREKNIPLFALESQDPIKNFDFLGITIQYEMCYTNILQVLDLAGIPLRAKNRTWDDPIVMGGGPCTYNPEPIADFFDIFYIGEGETRHREILDLYLECKEQGLSREEFLRKAACIPGMYVPMFYQVEYHEDGTIKEFGPIYEELPKKIKKEMVLDVSNTYYPLKPVVPFIKVTQDRVVLEIQRGCIRGCRFCQAGQLYRPVREREVDVLKKYALEMLKNTGYEEISLSSLSSSDYSQLEELINFLIEEGKEKHTNISLPSLRIDAFSLDVMSKVQDVRKSSLTFAPEAGSQRLRNVINKGISEEQIIQGSSLAFQGGWSRVKLYFMLGLPTETEEDIRGIAQLCNKVAATFFDVVPKEERKNGPVQIVASTSFFIPKPFTPFQWEAQDSLEMLREKQEYLGSKITDRKIKYNHHDAEVSRIEAVLARGDRRLSKALELAAEQDFMFDAWDECFDYDRWISVIEGAGLDPAFYANRAFGLDEVLPWDIIDCGVTKEFLRRERDKAYAENTTPSCREHCSGCGANRLGGERTCCPKAKN